MSTLNIFSLFGEIALDDAQYNRSLDSAERKTKATGRSMQTSMDTSLGRIQTRLNDLGRGLQQFGGRLSARLTAPLVAAGGAAMVAAGQVGDAADRLLDLRDITGLSTDRLQEFENVARAAGVETGVLSGAAEGLQRRLSATGDESQAFQDNLALIGVNARTADGELREMDDLLPEIMGRLADMESPVERNAVAMQLLGRSAGSLAPVLAMGSDEIERLSAEAHDMGQVMSEDTLQAANAYRQEMAQLRAELGLAGRDIVLTLMPAMTSFVQFVRTTVVPWIQALSERVAGTVEWFGNLGTGTQRAIGVLAGVAAGIGPAVVAIGTLTRGVSAAIGVLRTLRTVALLASGPAGWAIALATIVGGTLVAAWNRNRVAQAEALEGVEEMQGAIGAADNDPDSLRAAARGLEAGLGDAGGAWVAFADQAIAQAERAQAAGKPISDLGDTDSLLSTIVALGGELEGDARQAFIDWATQAVESAEDVEDMAAVMQQAYARVDNAAEISAAQQRLTRLQMELTRAKEMEAAYQGTMGAQRIADLEAGLARMRERGDTAEQIAEQEQRIAEAVADTGEASVRLHDTQLAIGAQIQEQEGLISRLRGEVQGAVDDAADYEPTIAPKVEPVVVPAPAVPSATPDDPTGLTGLGEDGVDVEVRPWISPEDEANLQRMLGVADRAAEAARVGGVRRDAASLIASATTREQAVALLRTDPQFQNFRNVMSVMDMLDALPTAEELRARVDVEGVAEAWTTASDLAGEFAGGVVDAWLAGMTEAWADAPARIRREGREADRADLVARLEHQANVEAAEAFRFGTENAIAYGEAMRRGMESVPLPVPTPGLGGGRAIPMPTVSQDAMGRAQPLPVTVVGQGTGTAVPLPVPEPTYEHRDLREVLDPTWLQRFAEGVQAGAPALDNLGAAAYGAAEGTWPVKAAMAGINEETNKAGEVIGRTFDPMAALSSIIGHLLSRSESFAGLLEAVNAILDPLIQALDPLFSVLTRLLEALAPLVQVVGALMEGALSPLVAVLENVVVPVFSWVANAIRAVYNALFGWLFGRIEADSRDLDRAEADAADRRAAEVWSMSERGIAFTGGRYDPGSIGAMEEQIQALQEYIRNATTKAEREIAEMWLERWQRRLDVMTDNVPEMARREGRRVSFDTSYEVGTLGYYGDLIRGLRDFMAGLSDPKEIAFYQDWIREIEGLVAALEGDEAAGGGAPGDEEAPGGVPIPPTQFGNMSQAVQLAAAAPLLEASYTMMDAATTIRDVFGGVGLNPRAFADHAEAMRAHTAVMRQWVERGVDVNVNMPRQRIMGVADRFLYSRTAHLRRL